MTNKTTENFEVIAEDSRLRLCTVTKFKSGGIVTIDKSKELAIEYRLDPDCENETYYLVVSFIKRRDGKIVTDDVDGRVAEFVMPKYASEYNSLLNTASEIVTEEIDCELGRQLDHGRISGDYPDYD